MRSDEEIDHVSVIIDEKLSNLRLTPPKHSIFKVHHQLRQVNEEAYEPQILAIGPYHHGKDSVQVMEEHKLRYLHQLLKRRNESNVERYVVTLRGLEQRARNCYAEPVSLSVDKFVEMMLLDGCFIIELFRKYSMVVPIDEYDPVCRTGWIRYCLRRDLLLFENQLPFFVLSQLFNMTKVPNEQINLADLALTFFKSILPSTRCTSILPSTRDTNGSDENSSNEIKHLLGLIHSTMILSFAKVKDTREENWAYIHCATQLQEAGVKFKKVEGGNLLDIKFKNGVMEIPPLSVEDRTESIFRNFIAYEQCYDQDNHHKYFTDYAKFIDSLINSSEDVELLRRQGIIENWLGDDEVVSTMFNKLGDNVVLSNFCYAELFNNVNKHCSRRWNVRMANLRRNYFHSPWAFLSVLAAVFLLVLTLVQTMFSVLSYFSQ